MLDGLCAGAAAYLLESFRMTDYGDSYLMAYTDCRDMLADLFKDELE